MRKLTPSPILAVLLDVGGTLWPDRLSTPEPVRQKQVIRLCEAIPAVNPDLAAALVSNLQEQFQSLEQGLTQDTSALVRAVLREHELPADDVMAATVPSALCVPAGELITPFPGATELLATVKQLGLRCVIVSNAAVRTGEDYRRDFADLGIAGAVDAVISSVDVGFRKPHHAIFERATMAAGCAPPYCAVIGNSERNDIEPAVALGMRTLRVAIEEPEPATSAAHAVVTSLYQATAVLEAWTRRAAE